jgi:hypothetical protein
MDPSLHAAPLFGAASSSSYVPPAAFGVGSVTEVFPTDPNTPFSVAEKSKKVCLHFFLPCASFSDFFNCLTLNCSCCILYQRPVPNWLREELLKKKSAPLSASAQYSENLNSMEANDAEQTIGRPDQSDSKSNDSAKSTDDDEDDEVPFAILITVLNLHTIDTVFVCCIQDQPSSSLPVYIRGHEERLTRPS